MDVLQDRWAGCYAGNWVGLICPEAQGHPAKFSRSLIQHIYQHAKAEGWLTAGSVVVDPFGGVSLGALDACLMGCTHVAVELEPRFHALALENVALWQRRFGHLTGYGAAVCLQGDSRRLGEVLREAQCVVSSPPYGDGQVGTGAKGRTGWRGYTDFGGGTASTVGQLAAMPPGDVSLVCSSPPYAAALAGATNMDEQDRQHAAARGRDPDSAGSGYPRFYGTTPGNLGNLPPGDVQAVITSPVYPGCVHDGNGIDLAKLNPALPPAGQHSQAKAKGYGQTPGQLGALPTGEVQAVITSPPYVDCINNAQSSKGIDFSKTRRDGDVAHQRHGNNSVIGAMFYGEAPGQLGTTHGDTFWSASRTILEQCYAILPPGGHAIFVVKRYVKAGALVDFPGQWAALCQAVGFSWVHTHQAMLVQHHGTQGGLFGGVTEQKTHRRSFFRALYENKHPENSIDCEQVLCFRKEAP